MKRDYRRCCGNLPPGVDPLFADALSPQRESERTRNPQSDHKTMQLCRQVQRALSLAFGDCSDAVLRELCIEAVRPAPNASRLAVFVSAPPGIEISIEDLLRRLEHAQSLFRREVMLAITRKRVPDLNFIPIPRGESEVIP
jgi:ribosome-binding factor A